jgi:hypothetical protein
MGAGLSILEVTAYVVNDDNSGGNYTVKLHTAAGTITKAPLTITGAASHNKVYDGDAVATVDGGTLGGFISPDVVTIDKYTAHFAGKNVGTWTVTITKVDLTGAPAGNYEVTPLPDVADREITAKHITGAFTADNKVYDGNTSATVLTRSLVGKITGDAVSLFGGTATFDNKNVGTGKDVTLTGASLDGADKGNYELDSVATAKANITPADLTITAKDRTKFLGETVTFAGTEFTTAGLVNGDTVTSVTLTSAGAAASAAVGTYPLIPSNPVGTGLSNYTITPKNGTLTVIYNWSGFFQPVDNNGVFNVVNAGRAIPVKFSLAGNQGLIIFAIGYPRYVQTAEGASASEDVIEETLAVPTTCLSFNVGTNQYNYVWKTEKAMAGKCYRLEVKLNDGTPAHIAYFKFTK